MSSSSSELQVKHFGSKTSFLQNIGSATSIKSIESRTKTCFSGLFKRKSKNKTKKSEKDKEIIRLKKQLIDMETRQKANLAQAHQSSQELLKLKQEIVDVKNQHHNEMRKILQRCEAKDETIKICSENLRSATQQLEIQRNSSQETDDLKLQLKEALASLSELQNFQENVTKLVDQNVTVYGDNCSVQTGKASQMVYEQPDLERIEHLLEISVDRTKKLQTEQAKANLQLANLKALVKNAHKTLVKLCEENSKLSATLEDVVVSLKYAHDDGVRNDERYGGGLAALQQISLLPVTADCIPDLAKPLHQMITSKYTGVCPHLLHKLLKKYLPEQHNFAGGENIENMTAEWLVTWSREHPSVEDLETVLDWLDKDLIKEEELRLESRSIEQGNQDDTDGCGQKVITNTDIFHALVKIQQMILDLQKK